MQKGLWKCHEPRVTTNQEVLLYSGIRCAWAKDKYNLL